MKRSFFAILCLLSLSACGVHWGSTSTPANSSAALAGTKPAAAVAPEIPLPLPRAESFTEVKPPVTIPSADAIESHVWAWASRQIETGALAAPAGSLNAALDQAAKTESQSIGELAAQVTRLLPLTQMESAGDALRYYRERYRIDGEFRPVVVAVAPVNRIAAFRQGAHVGGGTIGGVFYVPSRDAWLGPIDREALTFAFGSPYVIFLDESELNNMSLSASSVLVHELKHYLDYRRDASATPTYAEPAAVSPLRAQVANAAALAPALDQERRTAEYRAFVERAVAVLAQAPDARERIDKRYADYFASEWRTHLPYLLRPGEVSAFLEQVRYYKYWLNQSEAQVVDGMSGTGEAPAGSVALPPLSLTREFFRILYRAG